jgi:hypothetical protein
LGEEEYYRRDRERETEYYNTLVNEGGRPSHPVGLGRDILENPGEYREILSYWQIDNHDREGRVWRVFESQMCEWRMFRKRQRSMREQGRFPAYCQQLQDRLRRHGFERPFQLVEDLERQDKLATWTEFLNYEYRKYDKHVNAAKRLQSRHDEAWEKLVDANVLKPFETEESLWVFGFGLESEETEAEKAVESATSIVKSAEKDLLKAQSTGLSRRSLSLMEQKLSAARSKLAVTTELLEWIRKRCNLIRGFWHEAKPYRSAKREAEDKSILLRWILQQVPLIELELNPAKATENGPPGRKGRNQRQHKRKRGDDRNELISKRQRLNGESETDPSPPRDPSFTQQPRQLRSSHTKSDTLSLDPRSLRAVRAPRASSKNYPEKSGVVLDDSMRVGKGRQRRKFSPGDTPNSPVLRRSTRLRRPPERLQ